MKHILGRIAVLGIAAVMLVSNMAVAETIIQDSPNYPPLTTAAPSSAPKNVPDPVIVDWQPQTDLSTGLTNQPDVKILQNFLKQEGFFEGQATGNFFGITKRALQGFQKKNGLPATGYFGPLTRGVIKKILKEPASSGDLKITPQSGLVGKAGEAFSVIFKVTGGAGFYDIAADGNISGLSFTRNGCPPGVYCIKGDDPDSITLKGVPAAAGVYRITISAQGSAVSPCAAGTVCNAMPILLHGKATFMVTIVGSEDKGAPSITGIKGPSVLKTGETGTWSIQASDPMNGTLSYAVQWGDEGDGFMSGTGVPAASAFVQTAIFTHTYSKPGVYWQVFRVVNSAGAEAKTALTVKVGDVDLKTGSLSITSPVALNTLNIGDQAKVTAMYQPPMPFCPPGTMCAMVMPAPYPVEVSWSTDGSGMVSLAPICIERMTDNCTGSSALLTARVPGGATIKAVFTDRVSGVVLTAMAAVNVKGAVENPIVGSLKISPESVFINQGQGAALKALYQEPMPGCALPTSSVRCLLPTRDPYPVPAQWDMADSNIATVTTQCPEYPSTGICAPQTVVVNGVNRGITTLTASYVVGGLTIKASAKIVVQ